MKNALLICRGIFCIFFSFDLNAADEPIDYDSFAEKIKNTTSIVEAIALLPEGHRRYFTLAHTSRSLQESSFEKPRAIVYGPDAKFVVAFAGEASPEKPRNLEIIQYRSAERSFEFRNIVFPGGGKKPVFSEKNPSSCQGCHNGRPIWGAYPNWTGLYGFSDDTLQLLEKQSYLKFRSTAQKEPPYSFLPFDPQDPLAPYGSGVSSAIKNRPNLIIGKFFGRYQAEKIVHQVFQSPDALKMVFAVLGARLTCSIPQESWRKMATSAGLNPPDRDEYTTLVEVLHRAAVAPADFHLNLGEQGTLTTFFDGQATLMGLVERKLYDRLAERYPGMAAELAGFIDERGADVDDESKAINSRINREGYQLGSSEGMCAEFRNAFEANL